MPYVEIKVIEGVFDDQQRAQMIERVTDAMVAIEGEPLRPFTYVVIDEVKGGSWGVGGRALHAADVLAMTGGMAESH